MLKIFLASDTSAEYTAEYTEGSFVVSIKPDEIRGDDIGIRTEVEDHLLKGNFRLMNGNIYRVINGALPISSLLKSSEKIDIKEVDNSI